MEHESSSDITPLKSLRTARSLSQNDVAEAIGTNANTVSRWERGIATPSPYYRRKLAELFEVDPQDLNSEKKTIQETTITPPEQGIGVEHSEPVSDEPQTITPLPLDSSKTKEIFAPEPETVEDSLIPQQGKLLPSKDPPLSIFNHRFPHRVYIAPASIIIICLLILGGVFALPVLLNKSLPDLFPVLCSGNFQSANASIFLAPATSTSPDGEPIGLSEGANIFDLQRPPQEVQYKLRAAQDTKNNPQDVVSSLQNALNIDQTDAEAQIYLENWRVLGSNHPHITIVVGISFASFSTPASRGILQAAFIAQKECNDHNRQDDSKTQVVLMIANVGGDNTGNTTYDSAKFVANQVADQAAKDTTIVGIMGWNTSKDSINVNHQLNFKGSHLPMVSPSASSDELQGMSNFFRVCPPNKEEALMAAVMLEKKRKTRIATIYDGTTSYANNLKDDFLTDIKNNTVDSEPFIGDIPKTLQDALTSVLARKPDAIFFAGYISDLLELLKDISSTPYANLPIVGGDALAITNDYPNPLPNLHNVYFTAFASPNEWDNAGQSPPFFQDYKTNFGTRPVPTGLSSIDVDVLLSYDALLTLLHGIQEVLSMHNTITPSNLTGALKQITGTKAIQGITGRIAFKDNGDQQNKRVILEHIEGTSLKVDDSQGCFRLTDNCSP